MNTVRKTFLLSLVPVLITGCSLWYELFGITEQDMIDALAPVLNAAVDTYPSVELDSFAFPFDNQVVEFANADRSFVCSYDGMGIYQAFDNYTPPYTDFTVSGDLNIECGEDYEWATVSVSANGTLTVTGGAAETIGCDIIAHGELENPSEALADGVLLFGDGDNNIEGDGKLGAILMNNYLVVHELWEYAIEHFQYVDN